jgi:hypothetical protein
MANLQFLSNVTHAGRNFRGPIIQDNVEQAPGNIVDLSNDTTGLSSVAQNLIDRKLARPTNDPATHTTHIVGADMFVLPINAPAGSGQAPAIPQSPDGFPQRQTPAPQAAQSQAPVQPQPGQPTPEQIAALAASQN